MPPIVRYNTIQYTEILHILATIQYRKFLIRYDTLRAFQKKKDLYYAGCTVAVSYNKYHTVSQKISFRISVVVVVVSKAVGCSGGGGGFNGWLFKELILDKFIKIEMK